MLWAEGETGMDEMREKYIQNIEMLYRQHARAMVQLAYRRTGDHQTAEAMVQEVFLVACCKPRVVYQHVKPVGWLYSTLNKIILRELERAYRRTEVYGWEESRLGAVELELPMDLYLPRELTEQEQELILLRLEQNLSHAEIAEKLGISESACRQRLSRALKKCGRLLEEAVEP